MSANLNLRRIMTLAHEYKEGMAQFESATGQRTGLVWIELFPGQQLEIEWFERDDEIDSPACFVLTVRTYAVHHGLVTEQWIGTAYNADAAFSLIKYVVNSAD